MGEEGAGVLKKKRRRPGHNDILAKKSNPGDDTIYVLWRKARPKKGTENGPHQKKEKCKPVIVRGKTTSTASARDLVR